METIVCFEGIQIKNPNNNKEPGISKPNNNRNQRPKEATHGKCQKLRQE